MRWESSKPRFEGQRRKITVFLFLPRRIKYEWRWLETVTILQEVDYWFSSDGKKLYWKDMKWIDDEKEGVKLE